MKCEHSYSEYHSQIHSSIVNYSIANHSVKNILNIKWNKTHSRCTTPRSASVFKNICGAGFVVMFITSEKQTLSPSSPPFTLLSQPQLWHPNFQRARPVLFVFRELVSHVATRAFYYSATRHRPVVMSHSLVSTGFPALPLTLTPPTI